MGPKINYTQKTLIKIIITLFDIVRSNFAIPKEELVFLNKKFLN